MRLRAPLAIALLAGGVACAKILGIDDARLAGAQDGGVRDADGSDVGPTSCSASMQTDARNCGSCGHDCRGGRCEAGRCTPGVLFEARQLVEPRRSFTHDIAIADGSVVFRDREGTNFSLRACALEDCVPVGLDLDVAHLPVVIDRQAYLETPQGNAIGAVPLDEGARARRSTGYVLEPDVSRVQTVGLDPVAKALLYDVTLAPGNVHQLRSCTAPDCLDGQRVATFSGTAAPWSHAFADPINIYASRPTLAQLTQCPKAGCADPPTELPYAISGPLAFANGKVVGTRADQGVVVACTLPGCADGHDVVAEPRRVDALQTDGTWVYWASGDRVVSRCKIDGCVEPEVLYRGSACVACDALGLALGGGSLVWAEPDRLYRLVLP